MFLCIPTPNTVNIYMYTLWVGLDPLKKNVIWIIKILWHPKVGLVRKRPIYLASPMYSNSNSSNIFPPSLNRIVFTTLYVLLHPFHLSRRKDPFYRFISHRCREMLPFFEAEMIWSDRITRGSYTSWMYKYWLFVASLSILCRFLSWCTVFSLCS
jgi:hypothetical protein